MDLGQTLLTGFVGGLTVVVGVVVAETLTRVRNTRELILDRIQELMIVLPKYLVALMRRPGFSGPRDPEFSVLFERVLSCLADIRFSARSPIRGHKAIRREAEDLTARVMAALWVWESGGALTVADVANIGVGPLRREVLDEKYETLDKLAQEYQTNGFPAYPEDGD